MKPQWYMTVDRWNRKAHTVDTLFMALAKCKAEQWKTSRYTYTVRLDIAPVLR